MLACISRDRVLLSALALLTAAVAACGGDDDDGSPGSPDAGGTLADAAPSEDAGADAAPADAAASCAQTILALEPDERVAKLLSDGQQIYVQPRYGAGPVGPYLRVIDGKSGAAGMVATIGGVVDFALDDEGALYYASSNIVQVDIFRAPAGARLPIEAPAGQENTGAFGLAVDSTHVYYSAPTTGGGVRRAPREGGTFEQLAEDIYVNDLFVHAGHVYWHQLEREDGETLVTNQLARVPVAGGPVESLYDWSGYSSIAFGNDGLGDVVCWGDNDEATVKCGSLDGSSLRFIVNSQVGVRDVALFGDHLYWGSEAGIQRASIAPVDPVVETVVTDGPIITLAVDGNGVYYAHGDAIKRVPHPGC